MTICEWTDEYSVGVEEIDLQHKKLFQLIGELSSCLEQKESETMVEEIVVRVIDYVVYHFSTEEKHLVKLASRSDFQSHHQQHDLFARKVLLFQDAVVDDSESTIREALGFLTRWLQEHILIIDKKHFADLSRETVASENI